jgi:hypothetical protein
MTILEKTKEEQEFFNKNNLLRPNGVLTLRKIISIIQFDKIKYKIPQLLSEIEMELNKLKQSVNFIDNLINDPNKILVIKLRTLIEKLIGNSIERAEFEQGLLDEFHTEINTYLRSTFKCVDKYTPKFSQTEINYNIQNIIKNNTMPEDRYEKDDFKHLFDFGQISPIVINNESVGLAFTKEMGMSLSIPCFDFIVDDPLNKKRNEWTKNLQKYFAGLLTNNKIQDIVYNITTNNIIKFVNNDQQSSELTQRFTEYLIKEISHEVYEDKIKYSISSMINIEKRPNISIFEVSRYLIKMYEEHFTYKQGYTGKYNMTGSANKVVVEIYGDAWTEAYFKAVSNKLAENCYRNVAVNLIDRMADKLLEMIIDIFNKNNADKEKVKMNEKIKKLNELYNVISEYKDI